ncbi:MAG: DUF3320 domain-containing protein [Methanomicrobiales archaeon]|nr:DUF3320 domain-containing protein [Methanomicrobiales archaeon]
MAIPEAQIDAIRRRLLDLTQRNRLLNYRPSKARTIPVVDENPREVYDILVLREKAMRFHPRERGEPAADAAAAGTGKGAGEASTAPAEDEEPWQAIAEGDTPPHQTDTLLETPLSADILRERLFTVHNQARTALEEQGYSILYLALGFLEYTDTAGTVRSARAPVLLVPVELERIRAGGTYTLRWTGEEILMNLSLAERLRELDVLLPEFEMPEEKAGIDAYLTAVRDAIVHKPSWRLLAGICLDFFSFTKFVMFRDLDPQTWPEGRSPADHPLLNAVLNPSEEYDAADEFDEKTVDERLPGHAVFHVVDADSSQIAVIEAVNRGANLVVEGPPGTGKSQTITNVIAESLARGKSVLFVSEKMAALQVVKSRLDRAGLGEFCLELHSRKTNKRKVLEELRRTLETDLLREESFEAEIARLEGLKEELNGYVRALAEPIGGRGLSPFQAFCLHERARQQFERAGRSMARISLADPERMAPPEWDAAVAALEGLQGILPLVRPIQENPWRGCTPGLILPPDLDRLRDLLEESAGEIERIREAAALLAELSGCAVPSTPGDLARARTAAALVASAPPLERDVILHPAWRSPPDSVEPLMALVRRYREERDAVLARFRPEILDRDVDALLAEYRAQSSAFLKTLRSGYRAVRREVGSLYAGAVPSDDARILADLAAASECRRLRDAVRQAEPQGRAFFGALWMEEESDCASLQAFADWMAKFRLQLAQGVLTPRAIGILYSGVPRGEIEGCSRLLGQAEERLAAALDALFGTLGTDAERSLGTPCERAAFADLESRIRSWISRLDDLPRWSQYVAFREEALATPAAPLVGAVEEDGIEPDDLVPTFEGSYAEGLLKAAFTERPLLAQFVGERHENRIRRFAASDQESLHWNQCRAMLRLYRSRPRICGGASKESEAGILLREFNRKRGHMPIRRLMSRAGGLIQKIKPCFMMSPLSIAQFLDPRSVCFDLIVFDEASQVRPEDALGAFLRGRQVVVMGDSRQLPPTAFFDRLVEDEEDDGADEIAESILNLCRRSFPRKMLRWHYRSRHESLIAVSNREFYDNRLYVYPSAVDRAEHLGLHLVHLPQTVYDRGRSSANRGEARAVAEAVLDHYRTRPGKSLMVGTFNVRQQTAIREEVERLLRQNPQVEDAMKGIEPFDVKNLETIQGDERDVVFISVGFGFDERGKLSLNFGPLNQAGGERRLNVLITRAREKCVVFSNFRGRDLALDENAPTGLQVLKQFLEYAETGSLAPYGDTGADGETPLETSVYEFLFENGHTLRKQVGCAGFRVDLAVVDPDSPGTYLLGIVCDGARYHTSRVARDRDRLRQQILEGLGWRIHRVWSPDWYRNRKECERRLLEAIEAAKQQKEHPPERSPEPAALPPPAMTMRSGMPETGTMEESVPPYTICDDPGLSPSEDIVSIPEGDLVRAVGRIAEVEGPVHVETAIQRIRTACGTKRLGKKARDAVLAAIARAEAEGAVRLRGEFLWPPTGPNALLRRRDAATGIKLYQICDEEIRAGIELVLQHQFATAEEDLIARTAKLLGIRSVRNGVAERMEAVIGSMVKEGVLEKGQNGTIQRAAPEPPAPPAAENTPDRRDSDDGIRP